MKNLADIRARIKSVSETRKITGAMETISVAKMRKAMARFESNRAYFSALRKVIADIAAHTNFITNKYLKNDFGSGNTLFVVIASDKGLAGGFNHNVLNLAYEKIRAAKKAAVACVGLVAHEFFDAKKIPVDVEFTFGSYEPTVRDAREITKTVLNLYDSRMADEVYIVYTRLTNSADMQPEALRLLPLPADEFAGGDEERNEIEYEPSPEEVFEALIPQYITGTVYGTLIQSCASEHCSRRTAMHNATENAGEILDDLNTDFHRARQESVTGEIIDIATAAMGVGHEDGK